MNFGGVSTLLLGICFILPVASFYPNRFCNIEIKKGDYTLQDITEIGILTAVAKYFESTPLDNGPDINPGDLTELKPLTASKLYNTYYGGNVSPKNLEAALKQIVSENTRISTQKAEEALWHMNGEQLKEGNEKILQLRSLLNAVLSATSPDYKIARILVGRILHIMQMFYSNTDWLEMEIYKNYLKTKKIVHYGVATTYEDLGIQGKPFLVVENSKKRTCVSCGAVCIYNRFVKIRGIKYTSGYLGGQDVGKPKGIGKCSHGGKFDSTRNADATGGINKQSSDPNLSPHFYYHIEAAKLAIEATTNFFVHPDYGLLNTTGEVHFRGILNLGTGSTLAMVIDDTGSMSEEIEGVKNQCIDIVRDTAGSVDAPFNYVVVTFNDPGFGPAFVTKDPDACISFLSNIRAHGGGDCPEFALSGIELALLNSLPNSEVLFFTDADAKDSYKEALVASLAKETNSPVKLILTGSCSRRRRRAASSSPYDVIAEESGGIVYRGSKSDISELVKLLDINVGASLVYIAKATITIFQGRHFMIDETINMFTVTVSGQSARNIGIYDVTNGLLPLDETDPNVTVNVDLPTVFSIEVRSPQHGEWICTSNFETYDVEVTAESIVDFQYTMMTTDGTTGLTYEIAGSPVTGSELTIIVKVYGVEYVSSVEHVDLLSLDGDFIEQIILTMVETATNDTYTGIFIVPSEAFYVRLQMKDTSNNIMQRLRPTTITPATFQLVLLSRSTNDFLPGASVVSVFKLINTGTSKVFNVVESITGDTTYITSSVSPTSVSASNYSDANITHTLYASYAATIGETVTVTLRAEEPISDTFNYVVFSSSVEADSSLVVDNSQPVLTDSLMTDWCINDQLSEANCTNNTWSGYYEFTDNIQMGSIIYYPPIDIEVVSSSTSGNTASVRLSGTCCCPLLTVTGVDASGNTATVNANLTENDAPDPVCIPPIPIDLPPGVVLNNITPTLTTGWTTEELTTEELSTEKLSTEELSTEKLSTEELTTEKLSTEELSTEKLSTEELSTEKLSTEELTTEKLSTEELSTEKLSTEELSTEKLSTEELTTEKLSTEELSTEKLSTEELTTEKLSTEELSTEKLSTTGVDNTSPIITTGLTTDVPLTMDADSTSPHLALGETTEALQTTGVDNTSPTVTRGWTTDMPRVTVIDSTSPTLTTGWSTNTPPATVVDNSHLTPTLDVTTQTPPTMGVGNSSSTSDLTTQTPSTMVVGNSSLTPSNMTTDTPPTMVVDNSSLPVTSDVTTHTPTTMTQNYTTKLPDNERDPQDTGIPMAVIIGAPIAGAVILLGFVYKLCFYTNGVTKVTPL